jgi:CheY-like chemotaxis protein
VRDVVRLVLESAGYRVLLARDGDEGLDLFRRNPADLVRCDVYLPGKGGLETIRALRQDFPATKVVAMTGGSFDPDFGALAAARDLGAAGALEKRFRLPALLGVVEAALRGGA